MFLSPPDLTPVCIIPLTLLTLIRWRFWNRLFGSADKFNPTSLVNVRTTSTYTRLILKNPKSEPARGGTFVYLAVPGALGTNEVGSPAMVPLVLRAGS